MSAALFFLPGWALGRGPLQPAMTALGARFIDLPGYADTPLVDDFSAAVDQVAAQLPPRARLGGWSLGALIALGVAIRHPEKVGKLVLVAATPSFVVRAHWPQGMPRDQLAAFCTGVASDTALALRRFVTNFNRGDAQAKAVSKQLLEEADARPEQDVLLTGLHWLDEADLCAGLAEVQVPTLLLHGAADPLMPLAAAQALHARLANSRLHIFPDCAHAPFIGQAGEFLSCIRDFLHE